MANKPFKDLGALIENKNVALRSHCDTHTQTACHASSNPAGDRMLFETAMADVTPIKNSNRVLKTATSPVPPCQDDSDDKEVLHRLHDLVNEGKGFLVSLTSEYMAGGSPGIHPSVPVRLHDGEFAVQDYIDLHGMGLKTAEEAFERFMKEALSLRKNAVLIVHGRGLSSPAGPVLKRALKRWLTRGRWRHRVAAFASARPCDGGAGATYVLLRNRPSSVHTRRR